MKKILALVLMAAFMLFTIAPTLAMAQDAPAAEVAVDVAAQSDVGLAVIFDQTAKMLSDWKAFGWQLGLAALITLLISTMKNSFLRGLFWDKLPDWLKMFMAPLLSLLAFVLVLGKFSAPVLLAALTTGVGSQYLHEMLDALKKAPFVGEKWAWLCDAIGSLLKAPPKKL